jgi:hypothetical protein
MITFGDRGRPRRKLNVEDFLRWLAATALAGRIRDSLLLFPLLESAHVFSLALVVGTILVVDLRLLGLASAQRPFERVASDIFKWTWGAFALTAVTGALMFTTNAPVYYHNFYFRTKMVLLMLAGLNMAVFELSRRSVERVGKPVAVVSLALWITIIFMGRMIGFTTTRAAVVKPPPTQNFDDFLK